MPKHLPHAGWMIVIASLCLGVAGCGDGLKSKYDKIKLGMTADEVSAVMGRKADMDATKPTFKDSVIPPMMMWTEDGLTVGVTFKDGRVKQKTLDKAKVVDGKTVGLEPLEREPVR